MNDKELADSYFGVLDSSPQNEELKDHMSKIDYPLAKNIAMTYELAKGFNGFFRDFHQLLINTTKIPTKFTYDSRYYILFMDIIVFARSKQYFTYNQILSCTNFSPKTIDRFLAVLIEENILKVVADNNDRRYRRYQVKDLLAVRETLLFLKAINSAIDSNKEALRLCVENASKMLDNINRLEIFGEKIVAEASRDKVTVNMTVNPTDDKLDN